MTNTVVITGASSGIGRALALEYAGRGCHLGLTARRLPVLEELRREILAEHGSKGIRVEVSGLDVAEELTVAPGLKTLFEALGGVDVVIVNAGVNDVTEIGKGDLDKQVRLIRTNVIGAIATVDAAVAYFLSRGRGQVVGISSLASLQPIPLQAAYCASKAGFSMYLDSARIELKARNIHVTNILPGYVKTDIVEGVDIGKMPFAVSPQRAAREIADLVERRVKLGIVPAFPWKWLRPLFGHIPSRFTTPHQ